MSDPTLRVCAAQPCACDCKEGWTLCWYHARERCWDTKYKLGLTQLGIAPTPIEDVVGLGSLKEAGEMVCTKAGCTNWTGLIRDRCSFHRIDEDVPPGKPIKSDGGSTSYYELTLPQHVVDDIKRQIEGCCETIKIETGDVIEMLVGNDFDAGNIIKALRRIFEAKKGKGKAGTTIQYDINKCRYSIDEVEKKL